MSPHLSGTPTARTDRAEATVTALRTSLSTPTKRPVPRKSLAAEF